MKNQVITVNGVNITPKMGEALSNLKSNCEPGEMKENITRILFMLSREENSRSSSDFTDCVFMLQCMYDIADQLCDVEGGAE